MSFPTLCSITQDEININGLLEQITLTSTGAAAIFTGMVRGVMVGENPQETKSLEYESFKPMAEAKMKQVSDEIREHWESVESIAIVQRIGRLYPRTPTVLIACTSAHRDTGVFEAARYGIEMTREMVPVLKRK